jgi:hypothetical protein
VHHGFTMTNTPWAIHYKLLQGNRWQDELVNVEGGDSEMAEENARRKIEARWGRSAAYRFMLTEKTS